MVERVGVVIIRIDVGDGGNELRAGIVAAGEVFRSRHHRPGFRGGHAPTKRVVRVVVLRNHVAVDGVFHAGNQITLVVKGVITYWVSLCETKCGNRKMPPSRPEDPLLRHYEFVEKNALLPILSLESAERHRQ